METLLTKKEAYLSMIHFLEDFLTMVKSDDIASLLGSMHISSDDGEPMDPAIWSDWEDAVQKTLMAQSKNKSS